MDLWTRMAQIDRRIIYLIVGGLVVALLLGKVRFPVTPAEEVVQAYQAVDELPPGSVILFSIDYDAASMPELQPLLHAMLKHAFRKGLKVLMLGHWPLGLPLGQLALEEEARRFNKVYGEDYVFLGYRPGLAAVILNLGKEIRTVFSSDHAGTPLDSLPMMRNIHNYNDIALIVGLEAGAVGDYWVQFAQARYGEKIILGTTAVVTPDMYPYLQAGQIVGLIGGMKGAADYEALVNAPGPASLGMPAQTVVHVVILIFIIIGNIGYFAQRMRRR